MSFLFLSHLISHIIILYLLFNFFNFVNNYILYIRQLLYPHTHHLFWMFCVFTGDGYLQHYRRCCRDCWPTTGYTKYQSFFYWLHFGFKGGIKSITSSFTDLYYHNLRPQFISYAWGGWVWYTLFLIIILSHYIAL